MKVNLGKAINWSEEDLDNLSRITAKDIDDAVDWWHSYSPKQFKGLLDAKIVATNSEGTKQQDNT